MSSSNLALGANIHLLFRGLTPICFLVLMLSLNLCKCTPSSCPDAAFVSQRRTMGNHALAPALPHCFFLWLLVLSLLSLRKKTKNQLNCSPLGKVSCLIGCWQPACPKQCWQLVACHPKTHAFTQIKQHHLVARLQQKD